MRVEHDAAAKFIHASLCTGHSTKLHERLLSLQYREHPVQRAGPELEGARLLEPGRPAVHGAGLLPDWHAGGPLGSGPERHVSEAFTDAAVRCSDAGRQDDLLDERNVGAEVLGRAASRGPAAAHL